MGDMADFINDESYILDEPDERCEGCGRHEMDKGWCPCAAPMVDGIRREMMSATFVLTRQNARQIIRGFALGKGGEK